MARIVLKISGEYLGGEKGFGFDESSGFCQPTKF